MAQYEKLVQRIIGNPRNVRFNEIDSVLRREGWQQRKPGSGSSHFSYFKEGSPVILTVPFRRPHIGETYVRRVIEILELEEKYGG